MTRSSQGIARALRRSWPVAVGAATLFAATPGGAASAHSTHVPTPQPLVSESSFVKAGATPPAEADCYAAGVRCFSPQSMQTSYGVDKLISAGHDGRGVTIAIIDSFGYPTVGSDLKVFSQQFGLPVPCGDTGVACTDSSTPTFHWVDYGNHQVKEHPPQSHSPGQENSNAWAIEVALDVQWAHSMAPRANILLVTTPTAETLGVQGFPQMMDAEQYIVDHHLATVISQSFGAAEESFGSTASLQNLRHAFVSAAQNGVTVLASSGDGGTANGKKAPVAKGGTLIDHPTVSWPASDPLVTSVGGTYNCMDAETGTHVDDTSPGAKCNNPAYAGAPQVAWTFAGGGFSRVFPRPSWQQFPAGTDASYQNATTRGVPDIAYQASAATGPLVYDTAPGDASGSNLGDSGWYVVGGTSCSSPQWAGLVAIADQIAGHGLGLINDDLYQLANSGNYATYFNDVATGNTNQTVASIPGYAADAGWDPVTGLGTPHADALIPALAAAAG